MIIGGRDFNDGHTHVMGILNVTPDSFSDGGKYNNIDAALLHTKEMIEDGAHIIDIGGESTRPGYTMISDEEEIERVCPVIEKIKNEFDIPVSVDTYKSRVASAAITSGADLINDIWGLKYDDDITTEELSYIYNDVFGLSYLVKMLKIDGLDIYGKHVVYTKLTNSGQSLEDYKETVLEDYTLKQNMFKNQDLFDYVDNGLMRSKFFQTNSPALKKQIMFECLFPKQSYFTDAWQRHSYYGGLSTVCFENVEKFTKCKNHNGIVLDVNSLYPYIMSDRLLPYGQANY